MMVKIKRGAGEGWIRAYPYNQKDIICIYHKRRNRIIRRYTICEKYARYRGWFYCMACDKHKPHREHKTYVDLCRIHYLEIMHGIVALKCPKCGKNQQEATDNKLNEDEKYTYVPLDRLFACKRGTWFSDKYESAYDVKCWFCGFCFFEKD